MKKRLLSLLVALMCIAIVMSGCSVKTLFVNSGYKPESSDNTTIIDSGETNTISFNVVTEQKLSAIEEAKEEADYEEYVNLKKVLKRITKSVVEVYATTSTSKSAGAGVVIGTTEIASKASEDEVEDSSDSTKEETVSYRSYIATCHHVIESATAVTIKTNDGVEYNAEFIGSDPDSDICVMSVDALLDPVEFYTDTDELEVGESVVAIGNPLGTLGGTVTSGILSATAREITVDGTKRVLLQTDASINGGNSGGGLFTSTGFFIGLVNAKYQSSTTNIEGLGFAIPANEVMSITKQLVETSTSTTPGYIQGKYQLGYSIADYYANRWGTQTYVMITELDSSGSFALSGLKVGDIIKSVTYKDEVYTVSSSSKLAAYLSSIEFEIGDTLTFTITRNDMSVTVPVTIRQYIYGVS